VGGTCSESISCAGELLCVADDFATYCAPGCSADAPDCPQGYECALDSGACFKRKTCEVAEDCAGGTVCVNDGVLYCAPYCNSNKECPGGYSCASDGSNVCFRTQTAALGASDTGSKTSCSTSPVSGSQSSRSGFWMGLLFAATALASRRRSR
jgi:hypothetical protein